jgi:hypothetical protein
MKICLTCASHRPNRLIRRVEFIGNNAYVVTPRRRDLEVRERFHSSLRHGRIERVDANGRLGRRE